MSLSRPILRIAVLQDHQKSPQNHLGNGRQSPRTSKLQIHGGDRAFKMTDPQLVRSLTQVVDPRGKRRGWRWLGVWTACLAHWKMSARMGRMCVS